VGEASDELAHHPTQDDSALAGPPGHAAADGHGDHLGHAMESGWETDSAADRRGRAGPAARAPLPDRLDARAHPAVPGRSARALVDLLGDRHLDGPKMWSSNVATSVGPVGHEMPASSFSPLQGRFAARPPRGANLYMKAAKPAPAPRPSRVERAAELRLWADFTAAPSCFRRPWNFCSMLAMTFATASREPSLSRRRP